MTTIRQLIQTSPARANELFAKLTDTSENAIKTREKLFDELKKELELLARLEEQHLFPVLRKHRDLKDLVREALNDNKATRKLLTELDRTAKDSEEFATRVTELRRVFQQHVRDEKKELLPAVLKALSDEEAQAIVESIEDRKTEIEEKKRAEAEERRAAARQEREEAEKVQQAAETVVASLWAGPQAAQQTTRTAQDAVRTGLSTVTEVAQRTSDQAIEVLNRTGEQAQDLTQQSSKNLAVMAETGNVLARGFQDLSEEWFKLVQERLQKNLDGFTALARCRSVPELMTVQNGLMRDRLRETIDSAHRMAVISTRVADEAARTISAQRPNNSRRSAA
jgi:hypothetical protein